MLWTILGVSVAIVAIFCISVAEILLGKPFFESHREYVAATLSVLGIATWFVGRYIERGRAGVRRGDDDNDLSRKFVLLDLRYWGPMLVILGVITLFIRPLKQTKAEPMMAAAKPAPKVAVIEIPAPTPAPPEPKEPVTFPALKMQGVIFREDRPFAIINGRSYTVGDHVGDVLITSITRGGVALELSGEVKLLTLK